MDENEWGGGGWRPRKRGRANQILCGHHKLMATLGIRDRLYLQLQGLTMHLSRHISSSRFMRCNVKRINRFHKSKILPNSLWVHLYFDWKATTSSRGVPRVIWRPWPEVRSLNYQVDKSLISTYSMTTSYWHKTKGQPASCIETTLAIDFGQD